MRDRTADEDTEQIELFVITAYPNTGMPAIILPTLGMAGGKWDSSLRSVVVLDVFLSSAFSDGPGAISPCARAGHGAEGNNWEEGGEGQGGSEVRVGDTLIARDKHFSAVVIRGGAATSLACLLRCLAKALSRHRREQQILSGILAPL